MIFIKIHPKCTLNSYKNSNDTLEMLDCVLSSQIIGPFLGTLFVSLIVFMTINVHVAAILSWMARVVVGMEVKEQTSAVDQSCQMY